MNDRVRLSTLLGQHADADPPVEPVVPFAAMFGDAVKIVVAVLDRTAVLSEPSDRYDRRGVRHDQVLVDPAVITWRTRTSEYDGARRLNNIKPGATGAALMGRHRQPRRHAMSAWNATPIAPRPADGQLARAASDERALLNQREVEATKHRELAAHRQRQPNRIEEEAMSIEHANSNPAPAAVIELKVKEAKCFRCKKSKPVTAFPPIHRGPNLCNECEAGTGAEAPITPIKAAQKPRLKKGRATRVPRQGKTIKLGETVVLASSNGSHDKVIKLLEKRDALRTQLADVQAQLAEAIG